MNSATIDGSCANPTGTLFPIAMTCLFVFAIFLCIPSHQVYAQSIIYPTPNFPPIIDNGSNGQNGNHVKGKKKKAGGFKSSRGSTQATLNRALKYYQKQEKDFWAEFDAEMAEAEK